MATIPNLYLKWRAFRELVGMPLSDAQIGAAIFGEGKEGAPKFSKLIYGDYGCPPEIGAELAATINRRIETSLKSRALPSLEEAGSFRPGDFSLPLHDFVRKLADAARVDDEPTLDRAQDALLMEFAPGFASPSAARLVIERFSTDRSFAEFKPSGGGGPVTLQVGKHRGRLAVLGVTEKPAAAYTFLARDPRPAGHRTWELNWGETMLWLPSPSQPVLADGSLLLMTEPSPVSPVIGRFLATTVLLWDAGAIGSLDPRGGNPRPDALDEEETSRFLTNLRRLQKRNPRSLSVASAEYRVAN